MSHHNEAIEVLSSPEYERAFVKVTSGIDPALLPDEERRAVIRAREITATESAGYPMPQRLDPTRNRAE